MKKILTYTLAWDINKKQGYLTVIDEENASNVFGNLSKEEFSIVQDLLKEEEVFIDSNKWIVAGWKPENDSKHLKKIKL